MIKIEVDNDKIWDGSYIFTLEFFKYNPILRCIVGKSLGKLVYPTSDDYAVNNQDSCFPLILFNNSVVLKEYARLDIDSSGEYNFIYREYAKFTEFGIMIWTSGRGGVLNQCSESICTSLWYDLIRMGFRPHIGMFS